MSNIIKESCYNGFYEVTIMTDEVIKNVFITNKIYINLDIRLLIKIISLLKNSKIKNLDYLQIFELKNNMLIHSQEIPSILFTYNLEEKFDNVEIWAIQNKDILNKDYWTILYPDEY